jgi:hypothetical protein
MASVFFDPTVFIDRDGVIESVLHGYHSYDELREQNGGLIDAMAG